MKLTAYLLDDEENARLVLEDKIINHCPEIDILGSSSYPLQAIKDIKALNPELLFLDIAMPGMSGLELVEHIPDFKGEIIFVTAYNEYAVDAFKVCALGYLLKPVNTQQLVSTINNLLDRKQYTGDRSGERLNELVRLNRNERVRIAIPTHEGYAFSNLDDIIRCEGSEKYTLIYTTSNKFLSTKNIGYYVDILKKYDFFPTHKSHLINMDFVKSYDRDGLVLLKNEETVPVSRRRRKEFISQFV